MVMFPMRTLDRYVVRSFFSAAVMLLVALMALRIVLDLSVNMDEFVENFATVGQVLRNIGGTTATRR